MTAYDRAPVVVRRNADGLIHIGAERPTGLRTEAIGLHGADLVIDLGQPSVVPYAVIDDVSRALWWLQFVYGEAVTDEVRRLSKVQDADEATADAEPGFLAAPVLRFAVGIWLLRWWPSKDSTVGKALTPEGEAWLMTELGTLAWYAEDVFGGKGVANRFLTDHVEMAKQVADTDSGVARPLAIVRAVIESVPLDSERYEELARIENAIMTATRVVATANFDAALVQELSGEIAPPSRWRLADLVYREARSTMGHSTVEWGRVRARLLSAGEENVSWYVDREVGNQQEIKIVVAKGDRWEPGHGIYAAVFRNGSDEPEGLASFNDDEHALSALVVIDRLRSSDSLQVVVFDETDLAQGRPEPAHTREDRRLVASSVTSLLGPLPFDLAGVAPYELDPFAHWPVPDTA